MSKTVSLDKATDEALRHAAKTLHNLPVKDQDSRAHLIAALDAIGVKDVPAEAPASNPPRAKGLVMASVAPGQDNPKALDAYMEEKVMVMIYKSQEKGGDRPVLLQVNGRRIYVPRGEPVAIARKYLEVLDHAVTMVPEINEETMQVEGYREAPRFTYQVMGPAVAA